MSKVETYSAIQLFIQRAQVAQPDFALTSENAALIVRICRLVDGLPLAIELAAARVRMLALEQLADRLETSPAILSSANRLAPARQQTLQATISWSYQLLAPAERQLFRRLALVAGSFDLSLVEALQEHHADLRRDVVDLLAHLIDKSLVSVVGLDGTARYRLLDTLQHYGREQLQQSGETEVTYRRYQEWVCQLVEDAEAEIEHIRAVIRWLLQNAEAAPVVQISSALVTFCGYRAHTREVIQWLEKALAKAAAIDPTLETTAFFALGVLNTRRHRADPQGGHLGQVSGGVALTLACLGGLLNMLGDYAQAQQYLRESLRHFEDLGDHNGYLLALVNLNDVALALSDPTLVRDYLAFALSSVWVDGEIGLLVGLFEQLARMALLRGRTVQAAQLFGITAALYCDPPDQPPDAVLVHLQQAQGACCRSGAVHCCLARGPYDGIG